MRAIRILFAVVVLAVVAHRPAAATFHVMQIEQVIGGIDGSTSAQAIQLRMRANFQNSVSNGRLVVHDAAGVNPVVLIAILANVTNGSTGSRVLLATSAFATATGLTPDFTLTNPIPDAYLPAGSLTWENNFGTIYWRLSWGGASYTGPGTGSTINDADGIYSPPFVAALPSSNGRALLFQGAAGAPSTNNAADYALTPGSVTFTNNAGGSATIVSVAGVAPGSSGAGIALEAPAPNPVRGEMAYAVVLPRDMRVTVRVLDLKGRQVRVLSDGVMTAGRHGLAWAVSAGGPALSSGVYFLEMSGAGFRRTRRFVLIRG
ncbi:MAG: T9SS type A sorting domain-containing protein [Candidatus Eisenbacteria bacterium]|nr:T9SS type A sorting domain-containing protein [Candidatus Eisenbacteria bacterium]